MAVPVPWISGAEVLGRVSYHDAVRAVQRELRAGLDPAHDLARIPIEMANGQLLLMPSESSEFVGVKVLSVAPGNPAVGAERIQAVYVLMDAATLTPRAVLDGTAITTLRTSAVSAAAADLLAPARLSHVVVFGYGPQAESHILALRAIRVIDRVSIVARTRDRAAELAGRVTADGIPANAVQPGAAAAVALRDAALVVCATTAREPLFDGNLVPSDSCVIAVGSHEPDARELDSVLISRAQVVVEDATVALREAGDIIIAIAEGRCDAGALIPMRDLITGRADVDHSRPRVFKSTGMPWEDLVIASEVFQRGQRA